MRVMDASAITLSGLCLAHCLVLPVAAAALPVLGLAETEGVHLGFAALAGLASVMAFAPRFMNGSRPVGYALGAAAGVAMLFAAALGLAGEAGETPLTVAGALLLASVHAAHWASVRVRPAGG